MSVLGHRLRAYVRPSGFDPLSISGLQFWIDSDDASTFTYSSGTEVSQWNDKSGNARHVSQANASLQPSRSTTRNSLSTVAFVDANGDILSTASVTITQPMTIFGVIRYTNVNTGAHTIISGSGLSIYTNLDLWKMYGGAEINAGSDDANWHYMTWVANGASSSIRKDGVTGVSGNAGTGGFASPIDIGADWDGDMAEMLIYNTALGTTDRDAVESYLATKWGF